MGEKAGGGGGRQEETVKGSKHMSAPGRRVCVQSTRDQGMDGITEVPAACPHPVFFHFEVPAAQQSLGCPTTGIEGSRRDPIPPRGAGGRGSSSEREGQVTGTQSLVVAELVSLPARPCPAGWVCT